MTTDDGGSADTLVIVPTKGRPVQFRRLLLSLVANTVEPFDVMVISSGSETEDYGGVFEDIYWVDERSDHLPDPAIFGLGGVTWLRFAGEFSQLILIQAAGELDSYSGKLALAAETLLGWEAMPYRYLAILNDDHEVVTPGWDRTFKDAIGDEPFGLAYGPDGFYDAAVPGAPFMTSSFLTALGWIALPGLSHILIDNVWMDLAKALGVLHYVPEVRVSHHHIQNGEAEPDATYAETNNNGARNQADRERWWDWLSSEERVQNENALAALWTPPREIRRTT